MRVVLDTNVIVSAFYFPGSRHRIVFDHTRSNGQLLMSLDTFNELSSVLHRPQFDKYPVQSVRKEFIEALAMEVEHVRITETIIACKDPNDDMFLEVAISGKADLIVSGDTDLLSLNPFRDIDIISPAEYLKRNKL
jgi:uncharacterized protein